MCKMCPESSILFILACARYQKPFDVLSLLLFYLIIDLDSTKADYTASCLKLNTRLIIW